MDPVDQEDAERAASLWPQDQTAARRIRQWLDQASQSDGDEKRHHEACISLDNGHRALSPSLRASLRIAALGRGVISQCVSTLRAAPVLPPRGCDAVANRMCGGRQVCSAIDPTVAVAVTITRRQSTGAIGE